MSHVFVASYCSLVSISNYVPYLCPKVPHAQTPFCLGSSFHSKLERISASLFNRAALQFQLYWSLFLSCIKTVPQYQYEPSGHVVWEKGTPFRFTDQSSRTPKACHKTKSPITQRSYRHHPTLTIISSKTLISFLSIQTTEAI